MHNPPGPAGRNGLWLSLVERCVRDAEVVGSNPASPTTNMQLRGHFGGPCSAVEIAVDARWTRQFEPFSSWPPS